MNEFTMVTSLDGRRCLTDPFVALLPVEVQWSVYALLVCAIRPTGGDTTISIFDKAPSPTAFLFEDCPYNIQYIWMLPSAPN